MIFEDKNGGFNYANGGDEFYTQAKDIVAELSHYDLSGKIVYCNCDNPSISEFYKFFKNNFSEMKLKGLVATYHGETPKVYFYNGQVQTVKPIKSGKFQDNVKYLKRCDIVITNPPFSNSMSSELIRMARRYGKHVIIVGPLTLALQKEMFELIKNGQLNAGYTSINSFNTPEGKKKKASSSWWTTMPVDKGTYRTGKKYSPELYPIYDNSDAIAVDVNNIPDDYNGDMAVSPRFLKYLDRKQFDVVDKFRPRKDGKEKFDRIVIRRKPENAFESKIRRVVTEAINKVLIESTMDFSDLYCADEGTDITEYVMRYIRWSGYGEKDPTFSIAASKLHDALMYTLSLDHEDEDDRKGFSRVLGLCKSIANTVGLRSIKNAGGDGWWITTNDNDEWNNNFYIEGDDFSEKYGARNDEQYGIVYKTQSGVKHLGSDYRSGSVNGSSGYYTTHAKMTDEMKKKIYDMNLVPALFVEGSYHENWVYSVGVLPQYVSQLKKDDETENELYFNCEF